MQDYEHASFCLSSHGVGLLHSHVPVSRSIDRVLNTQLLSDRNISYFRSTARAPARPTDSPVVYRICTGASVSHLSHLKNFGVSAQLYYIGMSSDPLPLAERVWLVRLAKEVVVTSMGLGGGGRRRRRS